MVTHVSAEAHGDERGALLAFIEEARGGLRRSVLGLRDEQASAKPSASELSLAGLIKHVAEVEQGWIAKAKGEPARMQRDESNWHECFTLVGDETVSSQLAYWKQVADETEEFFRSAPDLNATFALPDEPWYPKGERVSLRWVGLHLIRELNRHAGHADIIRESLDGKSAWDLVAEESGQSWG
ncbi:DinB family protein [Streptomyces sp. TRM66268-LWL]|uniref:DinB family protein n=1 Tax=Streptomyces polyasparticus TaxID=2767826 RepID=A0ABR7SSY1_9ACTN|nr:DinB family protein [Streptomyces polyasparticus]MBC9717894.1 DinB family protein [Streptomyces polyasparticus]